MESAFGIDHGQISKGALPGFTTKLTGMAEGARNLGHSAGETLRPMGEKVGLARGPGTSVTRGNGTSITTKQPGTWALKPKTVVQQKVGTGMSTRNYGGGLTGKGQAAVAGAGAATVGGAYAVGRNRNRGY